MSRQPVRLAVSMGDPAGVGPEIILQAVSQLPDGVEVTVYGDPGVLQGAAKALADAGHAGPRSEKEIDLVPVTVFSEDEIRFGKPGKLTGDAAFRYVIMAVRAVLENEADAVVTAPIGKRWWMEAGHDYPGHTELIAEQSSSDKFAMMLIGPTLRVVPVTIHVPVSKVPGLLSKEMIIDKVLIVERSLREWFGVSGPRIACVGLNPHAGEGGKIGDEEIRVIEPAVRACVEAGIDVRGPFPADTLFARREDFDAIVCMYHDQALIPIKTLHPNEAVNVTLGLPIVRTSPDHGTAYDIAGTGQVNYGSMVAAIDTAARIVRTKRNEYS